MKFTYKGELPEGAESINVFGIEFPKGKAVEVTDEKIAAKLAGNQFFESDKADKK